MRASEGSGVEIALAYRTQLTNNPLGTIEAVVDPLSKEEVKLVKKRMERMHLVIELLISPGLRRNKRTARLPLGKSQVEGYTTLHE